MTKPEPFLLQPAGKDYLWGGNRLHTLFGKQIPLHPLAETWECSTHPDGCSIVASGVDKGKSLSSITAASGIFRCENFCNWRPSRFGQAD